jgi:fibronectin type 3 domain-containing protein
LLRSLRFLRPGRRGRRPTAGRPAFHPLLEALEDRVTPTRFAAIGDFGLAGAAEQHVADLVHGLNPDFVITLGDNNYPTGDASTIDANVGQYYQDFIAPYTGGYGSGSPTGANRFFPTLGVHDWGNAYPNPTGAQPYLDYFTLPGNERYYTFQQGPVQFFALDSDQNEPDGTSSTSAQAQWLQSQLAASTATWKIVYFHETPYSSAAAQMANPQMRWPFQAWGATAVLAGHDHAYERLVEDNNFPYFVNGLGGNGHDSVFGSPVPGSEMRYAGDFGAMLVDAESDRITFQLIGAWDHAGQVIDTYTVYTQPEAHLPDAPTGLTATAVASGQVNLAWTDNSSNETGFTIEESLNGTVFTQVGTAGRNAMSASVTGLLPGVTYTFRVSATNAAGSSAPTNTATATTPSALAPPSPSNLTGTVVSASTIKLNWIDNSTLLPPEDGFRVYDSTDGVHYALLATVARGTTAYTWSGAAAATTYSFQVTAYNAVAESAPSNAAVATTPPAGAPTAPTNLVAAAVSGSQIDLTWADNSANEDGFKLYRLTDDGWTYFATTGAGVTAYTWWGASPGTSYIFQVTAYNAAGESAPSNTATATTPAPPAAPSSLAAAAVSGTQVNLSWVDNSTNEDGFKLYSSTDGVNWSWFATAGANTTAYTWWGASPGTTYYFRVAATNAAGDSDPSNTVSVTTPAPPAAPSNLVATAVSGTQVNLTWTDNSDNEDSFRLYYSTDGVNWVWFAEVGPNVTATTWWGASPGTTYYFRVTAYSSANGESDPSNTASATTPS